MCARLLNMYYEIFGWAKGVGFKEVMKKKKLSICAIKKKIIFYIFLHIKIIMGQKEGSYWGQNDALAI